MTKKIAIIIMIFLILVITYLTAQKFIIGQKKHAPKTQISQQQIPGWVTLKNPNGWQVEYPPDWKDLSASPESNLVNLVGPKECFSKGLCGSITFSPLLEPAVKVPNKFKDSHTIRTLTRSNKDKVITITIRENIKDPMASVYDKIIETFKFND